MNVQHLSFDIKTDKGGHLVPLEAMRQVPFPVARVFFTYQIQPGTRRACHAHKDFSEVLVCIQGTCRVTVDDGTCREEIQLDRPDQGLCIGPGVWEEVHDCSPDCIVLGLADKPYDPGAFFLDYQAFCMAQDRQA